MTLNQYASSHEDPKMHYNVALNLPENKELIWEIWEIIGRWVQWVVYELSRPDQVLKLFFDNEKNLRLSSAEASRQEDFSDALLYAQSIGKLLSVNIPELLHRIYDEHGRFIGIIIKKAQWKTLHCQITEEIVKRKYKVEQWTLNTMSEIEILTQYSDDQPWFIYIEDMRKYFPDNIIDRIEELNAFFESHGLMHDDIHSANIIMWENGIIHLLDFGKSRIDMKKVIQYKNALDLWRAARREKYLKWPNASTSVRNNENDLNLKAEIPEFNTIEEITLEWVEVAVKHNWWLPRHIIDKSTAVVSLRKRWLNPGIDSYFYPNIVWYDLSGWYFLLGIESRVSNWRNEFSKEVLEQVMNGPIQGLLEDNNWVKHIVFFVNFPMSDILSLRTKKSIIDITQPPPDPKIL